MARIGDFTPESTEQGQDFSFGYFGTEMRVHPDFGELVFTDWADEFGSLPESDPRSVTATKSLMRNVVHPDDFAEFWRLARVNRQSSEDLARVFQLVLEAVTDRPTVPRSVSSIGDGRTRQNSADDSYSRAIARFETEGRPDLALIVDHSRRARSA